jgi:lipopolysaccharide export system protein LptA
MRHPDIKTLIAAVFILTITGPLLALESDRQQPLLVNADTTDGTLGDGIAIMSGQVEIRQGSLLVRADVAEVEKIDGRVRQVKLTGTPVHLQQEIENEGLVTATARTISYKVATGMVTLTGKADVDHPQYQISGEELTYDMNLQHFQGNGGDGNGRIRIELAPEVVPEIDSAIDKKPNNPEDESDASSLPQGASVAQDGSRTDHVES